MRMRDYQERIYDALVTKKTWGGSNVVVRFENGVSKVTYYWTTIAVVDHKTKTAKLDNGGFENAATTARINAVKEFCKNYGYTY
jgi:recombinational DNA repair protein RecT